MFRAIERLKQWRMILCIVFLDNIIKKCNQKCRNLYVEYRNLGNVKTNVLSQMMWYSFQVAVLW